MRTTAGTKNDWSFPRLYFWLMLFMEGDNESVEVVVVALKDQSIRKVAVKAKIRVETCLSFEVGN